MGWAIKPPKEVCESAGEYSGWILNQYERQARFGFGMDDIIEARSGYNLTAPICFAVWRACRKKFENKTKHFTVTDLIEIILGGLEYKNIKFDRTTICHTIGQLRALGLVCRLDDNQEYEYVFEDIIIRNGMDWFLKDNPFIINPPPLGGFMDDCLIK